METYWVRFIGAKLDVDQVASALRMLPVERVRHDQETVVDLGAGNRSLMAFLELLHTRLPTIADAKIEDIEIWGLLHRDDQANAELSKNEIALLHRLNATYCWSVFRDEP